MNPLQRSLGQVTAPEELKQRTKAYLAAEAERRAGKSAGRTAAPGLAAAFACLLLAILGVGGWQVFRTPVSYISIDVNPSIELALNRFDRVVETTAFNDDGEEVLSRLSFRGQTYGEAIDALFADELFQSYLGPDAKVVFTVVSDSEEALQAGIESGSGFQNYNGECFRTDIHCLEEAHANGLSVGKYRVYMELSHYGSSVTVEDCQDMTIGQLQQELDRCSGHGSGHHGGQPSYQPAPSPSATAWSSGHSHGHGHGGGHH